MDHVTLTVNGVQYRVAIPAGRLLADFLRRDLGLTGTKESCGTGDCGSCTVLLDGRAVKSCLVLAHECEGAHIETVEGLAAADGPSLLQRAFGEMWGTQCGYCTPGFIVAVEGLLRMNPRPTTEEIKHGIAGNLCRCTGYTKILEAIEVALERRGEGGSTGGLA